MHETNHFDTVPSNDSNVSVSPTHVNEQDVFLEARDLAPVQRQSYLKKRCAGDRHLLRRIEHLFDVCENQNFLFDRQPASVLMDIACLLYTSPSPRDRQKTRMPSSA